jgi:hypothetical protein
MYLSIMLLRGFVLYQGMNQVEDTLLRGKPEDGCWYQDLLRPGQASCYGRSFDFSDHVVLYFAQILPIGLYETLDFLYNNSKAANTTTTTVYRSLSSSTSDEDNEDDLSSRIYTPTYSYYHKHRQQPRQPWQQWLTVIIVLSAFYVYAITLWSAHRTAAYFHTAGEILAGFAVSMIVQLPLYYGLTSQPMRGWFFGL